MGNLLRLFVAAALVAIAIIVVAVGLATNDGALAAPAHLIVFLVLFGIYLLPTGLALYRDCAARGWIAALNILLGWTVFGWFIALGWAAGGKLRPVTHAISASQAHPVPGH
jgi:hypothetical protein